MIGSDLRSVAAWALRFVIVVAALWLLQQVTGLLWSVLLPILLAVVLSTVLRPPVAFLVRHRFPSSLAALLTMLVGVGTISAVLYAIVRSVIFQTTALAENAAKGLRQIENWIQGPPLGIRSEQISAAVDAITSRLQSSAGSLAGGALSTAAAAGSALVTFLLVLVLTFFFIKDAPHFLPWLRHVSGRKAGRHLTELLTRVWNTLGGFIRTQAIVSAVDAVLIGVGLLVLGVPLVPALVALTFFGGFIPIVGALVAGGIAVLVALVANSPGTALAVLVLILVVQQVESNVLQPVLQSRSMKLHPAIVILSVAFGGGAGGIVGAFFAVPVAATLAVALRYLGEQVDLRAGQLPADKVRSETEEGAVVARIAEQKGAVVAAHNAKTRRRENQGLVGTVIDRVRARKL
ncbi:MAG: AI-2E family transporter [Actinomycetota bacterium]|nr:AI-2E family transporter [Actinomycetota bacterium]